MRLTVIGCSGSFPGPDSAASCYLVEAPYDAGSVRAGSVRAGSFRLVLDLGNGALGPLQRHIDLSTINAVAFSHLHPDHCLDLCGLYVVRKWHPEAATTPLPVYGPAGTGERMARAYDIPPDPGMTTEFDFRLYPATPFTVGPLTLTVARVNHPVEAYAIRIDDGQRAMVYTGDTGPCTSIEPLARGCDLLLSEASFLEGPDNPANLHLTGREAAHLAERAGVGRLVLTHIPPWYSRESVLDEAKPHFSGRTDVATPAAVFDV